MDDYDLLLTRPKPFREERQEVALPPDMARDGFERHAQRRVEYQGPGEFTTENLADDDPGNDYPAGYFFGRF